MEKLIKKLIIIVVIIILLIVTVIIGMVIFENYSKRNDENIIDDQENYSEEHEEQSADITENDFYTVSNYISQYFDILNKENSAYYGKDDDGNFVKVFSDDEIKTEILNLLSTEYINNNDITINNVYDFVDDIEEDVNFVPIDMALKSSNSQVQQFVVSGLLENINYNIIKVKYLIVNLDTVNSTYSVEPLEDNKYNNIDEVVIENQINEIEPNDSNEFSYQMVTGEYIAQKYMDTFKRITLGNAGLGYQLLDEEYKNKRFRNEQNFQEYVQKNYNELLGIRCTKYLTNNYEDYEELVCQDQYQNTYVFTITGVNEYTIKMDTYTLMTDNFMNSYNSSEDRDKVLMNIDKWVQMLNSRDYKNAYNYLDETFRNNNFGSEENFENYMRQNYSSHYEFEFTNNSEDNGVFVQDVNLKDVSDENNVKTLTVIMQLKEDYNFVMSFEI